MREYQKGKGTGHGELARTPLRKRHPIRRLLLPRKTWSMLARFRPGAAAHYRSNRRNHRHRPSRLQMEKRS